MEAQSTLSTRTFFINKSCVICTTLDFLLLMYGTSKFNMYTNFFLLIKAASYVHHVLNVFISYFITEFDAFLRLLCKEMSTTFFSVTFSRSLCICILVTATIEIHLSFVFIKNEIARSSDFSFLFFYIGTISSNLMIATLLNFMYLWDSYITILLHSLIIIFLFSWSRRTRTCVLVSTTLTNFRYFCDSYIMGETVSGINSISVNSLSLLSMTTLSMINKQPFSFFLIKIITFLLRYFLFPSIYCQTLL